jgi:quercetin dioxygenase-like cupin family protein
MVVVVDFNDGPAAQPDPPHSHPHEQASYVAAGELILHMGGAQTRLKEGDLFTVPSGVPHAVQTLTPHVRIVDAFSPVREDFLK